MEKSVTCDMTQGAPAKLILRFMVPLIFGNLFQQLYNMVDTMVVGKFLGVTALAGVGSTGSINSLALGFCIDMCMGFAIPIAQKFGQKDYSDMRRYVANTAYLAIGFSLVATVLTCSFCNPILEATKTDPEYFQEAYDYIFVIFLGIPVIVLYNTAASIIRALGDSKTPLYFLFLSGGLNVLLDLLFVCCFHMGVAGTAWATVISQTVSGICCLVYMIKRFDILKMDAHERRPSFFHMKRLCFIGIPLGLQQSVCALGAVVLQSGVNSFGTVYAAAVTAGDKVHQIFTSIVYSFGGAVSTYVGQNIGAGRIDRVRKGVHTAAMMGCVFAVFSIAVIQMFGTDIAKLYVDMEDAVLAEQVLVAVKEYLGVVGGICMVPLQLVIIYRYAIQSMGYSTVTVFSGSSELIARCVLTVVFTPIIGFAAISWAAPIAWIVADVFLIPCYYICLGKQKKLYGLPVSDKT